MKKKTVLIIRYLLGIVFLINGVNMFAQFMPMPNSEQSDLAQRFLNILREAGYFYPILGAVKIATAMSLFTNRYLPLMLIIMFPVTLNGILFHAAMDPAMTLVAIVIGLLQVYLIYTNRDKYFPMLEKGNML